MASPKDTLGDYVRKVRESTQRYARDLLEENEKLLALALAVHNEKASLEREVDELRGQIERQRAAERSLMSQVSDIESTRRELSSRYLDVEQSNTNLANLYVASYGLHRSLEREDVVRSIHEVLCNLVGTEEFAILESGPDGGPFAVTSSMGLGPEQCASIRVDSGSVGEAFARGVPYVRGDEAGAAGPDEPTVCVPLAAAGRVRGAIVIFRLLAHKPQLEPIDEELFELLASHAASALYCSELHERAKRERTDEAAQ